jgi:transposase
MMNKLYVGIDIGGHTNTVFFMLPDGAKLKSLTVRNNIDGAQTIAENIVSALTDNELSAVSVGIEATSVYGESLMYYLREDERLSLFESLFYILNPRQVKKFKDIYNELPKNDDIDAFVIADNLRFGRISNPIYPSDLRYKSLQLLMRSRYHDNIALTREKQRFMNVLFRKSSGLAQEKIFSDSFSPTALALYESFETPDDIANMDPEQLVTFISGVGRNRFSDPERIVKEIQAASRGSYRIPMTILNSVNQVLSISISSMRAMQTKIKAYDKEIKQQLGNIPNTLTSIKGIGTILAAGIISEIGDINRFSGHAALAKYAGFAWSQYQSGRYEAKTTRLINSGNRYLKYYLYEAAFSLLSCDNEFKRYYDSKYKEVKIHQHGRALALTARKLIRLIYSLMKNNRIYIPA